MAVAASGYMTVIIDFSGLVAARRQADPGADRSGFPEVARIFDGSGERGCSSGADAWDRHEYPACLALTRFRDELAPKFGGPDANVASSLQHWQNDGSNLLLIDKKTPDVLHERGSLTGTHPLLLQAEHRPPW